MATNDVSVRSVEQLLRNCVDGFVMQVKHQQPDCYSNETVIVATMLYREIVRLTGDVRAVEGGIVQAAIDDAMDYVIASTPCGPEDTPTPANGTQSGPMTYDPTTNGDCGQCGFPMSAHEDATVQSPGHAVLDQFTPGECPVQHDGPPVYRGRRKK